MKNIYDLSQIKDNELLKLLKFVKERFTYMADGLIEQSEKLEGAQKIRKAGFLRDAKSKIL